MASFFDPKETLEAYALGNKVRAIFLELNRLKEQKVCIQRLVFF
jgi:hypothetical protein